MYQYRDSAFQFQHLPHSYYSLYNEWMDDEDLPPPDDPLGANNDHPPTTTNINGGSHDNDNPAGSEFDPTVTNVAQVISSHSNTNDNVGTQYWDYFDDEEDWEIFNKFNLQVESNGRIIYNHIVGQDVDSGATTATGNDSTAANDISLGEDHSNLKDVDIISGSLFDPRVFTKIRKRVNGWNDTGEQIS